jgi:hypothetical protein
MIGAKTIYERLIYCSHRAWERQYTVHTGEGRNDTHHFVFVFSQLQNCLYKLSNMFKYTEVNRNEERTRT